MSDEPARKGDDQTTTPRPAPTKDDEATQHRVPLRSVLFRQVGTLAGGALLGQATWGTPWFIAVVAAVVLIEGLIIWDWRHPKRRS